MKPFFFSGKGLNMHIIILRERKNIITHDAEIALYITFSTIQLRTWISMYTDCLNDTSGINDPIQAVIRKYENHPSILKINERIGNGSTKFSFNKIEFSEIMLEINNLNPKKANSFQGIPVKLLIDNSEISGEPIHDVINNGINESKFDDGLKYADITPVHKKSDSTDKSNCRPVSVLPVVSKVFERTMRKQIGDYMDKYLSSYLCGYRKGYNPQHAILTLLENWRIMLDRRGYGEAILMDHSKAFETLNHDLLITKLHAHMVLNTNH